MNRILGYDSVFHPQDPNEVRKYWNMIYVIYTTEGSMWDAENVSKAIFNNPHRIQNCYTSRELQSYVKQLYNEIHLNGEWWVNWEQLKSWLIETMPDVDHCLSWWVGNEK